MIPNNYTKCEYDQVLKNTPKAFLIDFGDKEEWVPKSQVTMDFKNKHITMPDWLYQKLGLQ